MKFSVVLLASALVASALPAEARAHPGGLNKQGCHNDRKRGGYHCHRKQSSTQRPARSAASNGNLYFANCSQARAAGRRNIRRGEPGYRPALDRDDDGIACEG